MFFDKSNDDYWIFSMQDFKIHVSQEGKWFLAKVENHDQYYAQGLSYEESISNLFAAIQAMREIDGDQALSVENEKMPAQGVSFSMPSFA